MSIVALKSMSDGADLFYCRLRCFSNCILEWFCVRGLVAASVSSWIKQFPGAVSRSQWTLSSPGVRVLPKEGPADGATEGPSAPHRAGRW